jgi:hypothetical protein
MVRRIAVGLLGRQRHDSIDACGSLNIEYPEGAEHLGMASRRNVELIQRPPDCNAQQNGGGHRRRFRRCRPH